MADPLLNVQALSYTYSDGTEALRGVNLAIAPGERVGLIGPNGSGKSTLLLCMSGLLTGIGSVRLNGAASAGAHPLETGASRGRIGLIFQSPDDQLFMPTLADDIGFGPVSLGLSEDEVHRRVHQAAEQMGLADMLDRAPHHLSMGQKRNAAIATVLAMQPAILLMDEPSSNLDPRSRRQLLEVLGGIDAAMVIASHDLALVGRLCRRVVVIDAGRIVVDGPTTTILSDAPLMEQHGLEAWVEGATTGRSAAKG